MNKTLLIGLLLLLGVIAGALVLGSGNDITPAAAQVEIGTSVSTTAGLALGIGLKVLAGLALSGIVGLIIGTLGGTIKQWFSRQKWDSRRYMYWKRPEQQPRQKAVTTDDLLKAALVRQMGIRQVAPPPANNNNDEVFLEF